MKLFSFIKKFFSRKSTKTVEVVNQTSVTKSTTPTHDVFGEGKVIGVDGNLIIVDFDNHGRKTMVGNHVKLHLVKKGGDFQA